jgi:hypothetical protein
MGLSDKGFLEVAGSRRAAVAVPVAACRVS